MKLKNLIACGLVIACRLVDPGIAADQSQILFSNPLVRENVAVPKLQSLRFVTVDGFAPFSAFDENNVLRGVNVDLARGICAELNLVSSCTMQVVAFKDVENLLSSGQADIALAGLVPSSQNRKTLGFSTPYFRYPSRFLVQRNSVLSAQAPVGVINGSTHQAMAQALFPELKLTPFANESNAIAALKQGTVSAFFGDGLRLAFIQSQDQTLTCCQLQPGNYFLPAVRPDTLSAAVSMSRPDILIAMNTAIRKMAADGRMDEIYLRHLAVNPLK